MKSAAFVVSRQYVDAIPCLREPIEWLANKGWKTDVFTVASTFHLTPSFMSPNVRVYTNGLSKGGMLRTLSQLALKWPRYDCIFAVPQADLYYASLIAQALGIPLICISDELYVSDPAAPVQKKWKRREIKAHRKALLTIALTAERAAFVRTQHALAESHRIMVVPNAPSGESRRLRSRYYRDALDIPDGSVVLLHAGSLWCPQTQLLMQAASGWTGRHVAVFQGRIKGMFKEKKLTPCLRFQDLVLPSGLMDYAVSSADIGVGLYEENDGLGLVGVASSKLGVYLKNGLPVIFSKLHSFRFIEENGLGICVDSVDAIPSAADRILGDYGRYCANVKKFYDEKLNFDKNFGPVAAVLNGL